MRRMLAWLLLVLLLLPAAAQATTGGDQGSSNYTYAYFTSETLPAPPAYTLERSITARDLPGVDALSNMMDAHVRGDAIYIVTQTAMLVLNTDYTLRHYLTAYTDGGEQVPMAGLTGLFVTEEGEIYLAQAEQGQILHLNPDFSLKRVLGRPDITGFEDVNYRPTKLVVDDAGRLFVVAKGMYEGIVEMRPDGSFSRFYGVNEVKFSFFQMLWRRVATEEQRSRMQLWLPSDFTNLCIDADGFIFATVQGDEEKSIRRLNSKGENILRASDNKRYPQGDEWTNNSGYGIPTGKSQFIAVDSTDYGMYVALDSKRSRIFGYNEDNKLLFVLGGIGDREGYFRNPVDVDFVGNDIMVLDQLAESIEVFAPTQYGQALTSAVYYQRHFDYDKARMYWEQVLEYNHNFTLAYSGIGRALLRDKEYEQAMEYLQMGQDRKYYTKAFEKVRNQQMREGFVPVVCGALGLIVVWKSAKYAIQRRKRRAEA